MKILLRFLLLVVAAAFVAEPKAAYTNYLDQASNAVAAAVAQVNQIPPPLTRTQARLKGALNGALRTLRRPSASLLTDYNIFVAAAIQLLPLQTIAPPELAAPVSATLSNAYLSFFMEAATEVFILSNRLNHVTPFQPLRNTAGRQVAQANNALIAAQQTTNPQFGVLFVRNAYVKLAAATRLTGLAEARPGFAPNSLAGKTLDHQERGNSGTVQFTDGSNFTSADDGEPEVQEGTYTYERTGLNNATLVLTPVTGDTGVTTVKLRFKSATEGTFTFTFHEEGGRPERGAGRFTLSQ